MATLNTVADEIIGALERPFDVQFRERVKSALRNVFAELTRQQLMKYGNDDQFSTIFQTDFIPYEGNDCGASERDDCWISENEIPTPVRTGSDVPFKFVGSPDYKVSYIYTKPFEMRYADMTEVYQDEPIRYYFLNNKHLVICGIDHESIPDSKLCTGISGNFPVGTIGDGDNEFYDDMALPFPLDLIQTAKERLLQGELTIRDDKVAPELTHIDNE